MVSSSTSCWPLVASQHWMEEKESAIASWIGAALGKATEVPDRKARIKIL